MDRKLPENPEIQRLIRLSAASRSLLETEASDLRQRFDVPSRIRHSLQESPTTWLFGSLASGLAASLMFRRKPPVATKRRGIPALLFGLTLTAARPLAKVWLANQLKQWASGATGLPPSGSQQPRPAPKSKSP
jgi:hypothetical protein